ncbi:MAG TPA: hypothetical protein DCP03_18140 [Polaromonas sp.]|uniref:hypothetical protein n=1 Tax=Polaromonas sp. UBA4122 TaxID=1947074 RepID=UPI000EEC32A4|nr:hypothetical protein [Polaromonas sp. UBA4122]HAL39916.1 hypothetical protein [Polaromonas sp.]
MTLTRRQLLKRSAGALPLGLMLNTVWAAQPVVEIISFAHPPMQSALKPLRDWLASQGGKLRVVEIDMESPEAEKRLKALGLKGHIPIVVVVDGRYKHVRKDGSHVDLVGFPSGPGAPVGMKDGWSVEDVQAVLKAGKP